MTVSTQASANPAGADGRVTRRERFKTLQAFVQNRKALVGLIILLFFIGITALAPVLAHRNPLAILAQPWQPPSSQYWLGTTYIGQDVFSQWVWGTRDTLYVGFGAGLISTLVATVVGIFAGYKGGWADTFLNQLIQIWLVIPTFPLIIVVSTYVRNAGPNVMMLIIGLTLWAYGARQKRAQAMTFAQRDFVVAAKLAGMGDLRIILHQIFPNMISFVFSTFIGSTIGAIMFEAGLDVIGVGSPTTVSWGNMLNWAQQNGALINGAWWWFIPPGLSIALIGLSLALMNFALDEIGNPRLRRIRRPRRIRSLRYGEGQS